MTEGFERKEKEAVKNTKWASYCLLQEVSRTAHGPLDMSHLLSRQAQWHPKTPAAKAKTPPTLPPTKCIHKSQLLEEKPQTSYSATFQNRKERLLMASLLNSKIQSKHKTLPQRLKQMCMFSNTTNNQGNTVSQKKKLILQQPNSEAQNTTLWQITWNSCHEEIQQAIRKLRKVIQGTQERK